jgi:hypothetical protein
MKGQRFDRDNRAHSPEREGVAMDIPPTGRALP